MADPQNMSVGNSADPAFTQNGAFNINDQWATGVRYEVKLNQGSFSGGNVKFLNGRKQVASMQIASREEAVEILGERNVENIEASKGKDKDAGDAGTVKGKLQSEDLAFHKSYTPDQKPENTIEQRNERDMSLDAQALAFAAKRREELANSRMQHREDDLKIAAEKDHFSELSQHILEASDKHWSAETRSQLQRVHKEARELADNPKIRPEAERRSRANDMLWDALSAAHGDPKNEWYFGKPDRGFDRNESDTRPRTGRATRTPDLSHDEALEMYSSLSGYVHGFQTSTDKDVTVDMRRHLKGAREEAQKLVGDDPTRANVASLKKASDMLWSAFESQTYEWQAKRQAREAGDQPPDVPSRRMAEKERAVPAEVSKRFIQVDNKFHFPDRSLAFEDRGAKLATKHENQEVVRSLVAVAHARGWERINVKGTEDFRRAAWLEASLTGIEVSGYKPTKVERAHLEELLSRDGRENTIEEATTRTRDQGASKQDAGARDASPAAPNGAATPPKSSSRTLTPDREQAAAVAGSGASGAQSPEQGSPAADTPAVAPSPAVRPGVVTGKLLDHGEARYQHNPKKDLSYFVKVETPAGERTVWGVDLRRAMAEAGVQKGERIALEKVERKPVTAQETVYDGDKAVGRREVDAVRNGWSVGSVDKAEAFVSGERAEVVKKHPELAPAYGTVAAARKFAEKNFANKEDQDRFVAVAQQVVAEKIVHGEQVPAPKIREARVAKKDQQAEQTGAQSAPPPKANGASGGERSLSR